MRKLTNRQKEVIEFIKKYHKKYRVSPAIRDIASNFNISVKGAYDHLIALEKKNVIFRHNGLSRNIIFNEDYADPKEKNKKFKIDNHHIRQFNKLSNTARVMKNIPKANECIVCRSKDNLHRHHEDYSKPKDIIEFCRKHHVLWHVFKRNFKRNGLDIQIKPFKV